MSEPNALPPIVDAGTWQCELDALRAREKAVSMRHGLWRCAVTLRCRLRA
jgi:hypothetical protein